MHLFLRSQQHWFMAWRPAFCVDRFELWQLSGSLTKTCKLNLNIFSNKLFVSMNQHTVER